MIALPAENGKAQGANLGELSENLNNVVYYGENTGMASLSSPWLRCSQCNGITHRNAVDATPSRQLCCACCGSPNVKSVDLRAELEARRKLHGGEL